MDARSIGGIIPKKTKSGKIRLFNKLSTPERIPLLMKQREEWIKTQPFKGKTIIHNAPITEITVEKIKNLVAGGARKVLVVPFKSKKGFIEQKEAIAELKKIPVVDYVPHHNVKGNFDLAMDCGGQILDMKDVTINDGAVELTQTGSPKYKVAKLSYNVIDIDPTFVKRLENMFGSGKKAVEAIRKLCNIDDLSGKKFVVFGFGKLGKGITRSLKKAGANIIVVEPLELERKWAEEKFGCTTINSNDIGAIKAAIKSAFCIVTATGKKELLSENFTPKDIGDAFIGNMGAEDEIGKQFNECKRLLFDGDPFNFALLEPTDMEVLDPSFRAHNEAAAILINDKNLQPGYQIFPKEKDEEILREWLKLYPRFDVKKIELRDEDLSYLKVEKLNLKA